MHIQFIAWSSENRPNNEWRTIQTGDISPEFSLDENGLEETSLSWFFATKFDERGSINPDAEPCESFNNNPIILHEGDIRELSRMPSVSQDFISFAKSAMADDKCVYVDVSW